jgi:hypothetical protein
MGEEQLEPTVSCCRVEKEVGNGWRKRWCEIVSFFSIGEISFLFTAENLIKAQALKMLVSERRESLEHHP